MDVGFCVFNGMTVLDFVGAYDPITRLDRMDLAPLDWDVCAVTDGVAGDRLSFAVDRVSPDLGRYDLVFFPGGFATRELRHDESFVEWVRTAADCDYVTAVCTGALLLGAAGFLEGRRATTHPNAFSVLEEYATVVDARVVRDGHVITGRGVSSAIDLGLAIVETVTDTDTRLTVAEQMDYPYGEYGYD